MSVNLIDAAKSLFTNDVISKAGAHLNESESGISKALSGIIPTVFSGLLNKSNSQEGATTVAQMVNNNEQTETLTNPGNFFSAGNSDLLNRGSGLLGGLFGGKSTIISDLISNYSGVKTSSSNSLLGMVLPVILGLIGKYSSGSQPSAISSLLNSQRDNIRSAIPAGLNLDNLFGQTADSTDTYVRDAGTTKTDYNVEPVKNTGNSSRFLIPLLIIAGIGLLAYMLFGKGCNRETETIATTTDTVVSDNTDVVTPATVTTGSYDSVKNEFNYNPGSQVTINLPNNSGTLEVGEYSTENRLYQFLSDNNSVLDTAKGNWFEFTNVKFVTGSSNITEESLSQLRNLVAITKAFPNAQFRIGGYTDNTGDAASNIALSQRRAEAVAKKLKELGAASKSIEGAKGYGPEWPAADNSTSEGRAQNRRVAVNVKSK